jgi:UDP-N-acetylmuramoyl-L-alanyl-D-glutamate--2,6-diaminopimelate ligase
VGIERLLDGAVAGPGPDLFGGLASQGAMIERLTSDSRRAAPGVAFFAWPGEAADGRRYIAHAIERGASAIVWEREGFDWRPEWRVPNAPVAGLKREAGFLASEFYGRPSEQLWMCGVTGTNGKTSCTQWLAALLGGRGEKTGVIGTLGAGFPGALAGGANTTPDALELHATLAAMRRDGARAVAMEVSSHGLEQGRVNGVAFDCALFTNLTHEHLDYHGSMQAYAEAKAKLFDTPGLGTAVLNLDDVQGLALAGRLAGRALRTIGTSLAPGAIAPGAVGEWVRARELGVVNGARGAATRVALSSSWGDMEAVVGQVGRFNLANALGVLGCLVAYGIPFGEGALMLEHLPQVPGRMQRLGGEGLPLVVVDYAHTPDALDKVLQALRPLATARGGRLAVVFGAGGDRDPSKRPLMGAAAARLADRVLVTSDNPRSEDPLAIIAAIAAGAGAGHDAEPDRAAAIGRAVAEASAEDVVLVAGKGHEDYQEIAGRRLPFSDAEVAAEALARWRGR